MAGVRLAETRDERAGLITDSHRRSAGSASELAMQSVTARMALLTTTRPLPMSMRFAPLPSSPTKSFPRS